MKSVREDARTPQRRSISNKKNAVHKNGVESSGGDDGIRTHDPHVANVVLSQLSYIPRNGQESILRFYRGNVKLHSQVFSIRNARPSRFRMQDADTHSTRPAR